MPLYESKFRESARRRSVARVTGLRWGQATCSEQCRPPNPPAPPYRRSRRNRERTSTVRRVMPEKNPFESAENLVDQSQKKIAKQVSIAPCRVRAVCDLDNTFFKMVDGRPLRSFSDTKVQLSNIRDIAMCKANAAFLQDRIVCIQNALTEEREVLWNAQLLWKNTTVNFFNFLKYSHEIPNEIMIKANNIAEKVALQSDIYARETYRYVNVRSILASRRVQCEILCTYRRYFNEISPNWWRRQHDENYQGHNEAKNERQFPVIEFPRYDGYDIDKTDVLKVVLDPQLYFTSPDTLMGLYQFIQNQCLNYLENGQHMGHISQSICKSKDKFKQRFKNEVEQLKDEINLMEQLLMDTEELATDLRYKCEIVAFQSLMDIVCSKEAIKLTATVEYVHKQLFGVTLGRREIFAMAKAVEACYLEVADELDKYNPAMVKSAEREYFSLEVKTMRLGYQAQSELQKWQMMTRTLHAAWQPPPPCPRGWRAKAAKESFTNKKTANKKLERPDRGRSGTTRS